jgi:hypothetical protein
MRPGYRVSGTPSPSTGGRVRLLKVAPNAELAEEVLADAEPERAQCCGRTYLAQGMVDEARAEAGTLLGALSPRGPSNE